MEKENAPVTLIDKTKSDLEEIVEEKTKGAIFRSRCKWLNEGEKSTKYFLNMEKARSGAKSMNALLLDSGEVIKDQEIILEEQACFYEKLYKADNGIKFEYQNTEQVKVTKEEKDMLNDPFTISELASALKDLSRGKTPGCDGLTTEFYIVFFDKLKYILHEAFQHVYQEGKLYESATRGIITSIPKKGRDSRRIKNLHPITLLNVDYKLIEKMMANRLKPVLNQLIHTDQKGFLANRRISSNIRLVMDILDKVNREGEDGLILLIDYEKAFDRIETKSLIAALEYFEFGEYVVNWTKIFYKDAKSYINNNGFISREIKIERSVRQGAPCSAYYFIICAEILAILL